MSVFQVGDRVRLKSGPHRSLYKTGDTGTITAVLPPTMRSGVELYEVHMDQSKQALYPALYADELELA
jgi:hypothetical protein